MATGNPAQKLVVVVAGDTSAFEASLTRAQQKAGQFSSGLSKQAGGARSELLALAKSAGDSRRASEQWMEQRRKQLALDEQASGSTALLAARYSLLGAAAYTGVQALRELSKSLEVTGDAAGTAEGRFRNLGASLLQGDLVGGIKALSVDGSAAADQLLRIADTAKLTQIATDAASIGMTNLAEAARKAAAEVLAANSAFSNPSQIRDSTSPGAIAQETSGNPLPTPGKRAGITVEQRNRFFDAGLARQLDRNQDIGTLQGQVTDLRRIEALIQQRIDVTKDVTRKLNLEDQLVQTQRRRKGIEEQIAANVDEAKRVAQLREQQLAEARKAQLQARQFRALGRAADGSQVVPGEQNLLLQLQSLTKRIDDADLKLPSKLKSQLEGARKELGGQFGSLTRETRAAIEQLFDTIRSEFDRQDKGGPLTKTTSLNADRILNGLGIGRDAERILRARLSHFNSAGTALAGAVGGAASATIVVHHETKLDGRVIEQSTTKHQQQRSRRNSSPRRGR